MSLLPSYFLPLLKNNLVKKRRGYLSVRQRCLRVNLCQIYAGTHARDDSYRTTNSKSVKQFAI